MPSCFFSGSSCSGDFFSGSRGVQNLTGGGRGGDQDDPIVRAHQMQGVMRAERYAFEDREAARSRVWDAPPFSQQKQNADQERPHNPDRG